MKNWQDIIWKLLFGIVIIFFGGWILGGMLNLAATASPRMVSVIFCPAGTTATTLRPGQIVCQGQNGGSLPPLTDAESVALQRKYFYTPSLVVMAILVTGWLFWPIFRRVKQKQTSS